MNTIVRHLIAALTLAALIFGPGVLCFAQAPPAGNSPDAMGDFLLNGIRSTPGSLGVEVAQTGSGKNVIFAWFENKKAALAWYYSPTHQALMKMGGTGGARPAGPMADVPDDGKPILAIATVTMAAPGTGVRMGPFPALTQISIELYAPLPGGIAIGGRFAPPATSVPGLIERPLTPPPSPAHN